MQDQAKTKAQLLAEITELRQEVSRLKQAEAEIRASEAKFRTLYESTSDAVMVLNEKGFLDCNDATMKMFGYDTFDQFLNTHPSEQSPPVQPDGQDSLTASSEKIAMAMQEGINRFEWVHRRADGSVFPAEVLLTAIELEGQQVLQAVVRDITERRQTEAEIRASEAKFRTLYESTSDAVMVFGETGFIDCNDATLKIFGYDSLDQFLNTHPSTQSPPTQPDGQDSLTASNEKMDTAMREGTNRFEWVHRRTDGSVFPAEVLLTAIELEGQQVLQAVVRDITERRQAEEALSKRATELETVAQVGTAATTILDEQALLQEVADLTKEQFGLYHAHIYRLNEAGDTLVLAAGAGDAGRVMVAEGWSISLAREKSLVARAARTRQGLIVNDTHQEPDWLPNPLLPDTHSEMAVPMIVGDQVLGVLDIQAAKVDHFTDEDIRIQTTLAAQVAVALQNARLFEQAQRQARQEQILREVTAQVRGATDPDAVIRASLRALGDALGRPTFVRLGKVDQPEI